MDGFRKLGWEPGDPDDPTDRDPVNWLHRVNRYRLHPSWLNLGVLVPESSETRFVETTHRARLPDGVSHATMGIHSITPSLVGVVICFVFEEEFSKVFDRSLREQRSTFTTPTRRGERFHPPENQKYDDVRRIRTEISESAAAWFQDHLPGEFASGTFHGEIPTCELVTTREAEPFPAEAERHPGENQYLGILGLQDNFNVWRCVGTPDLKVKLRLSANRDPINHAVAAIKEEIPLWKHQTQGNGKHSRIAYLDLILPHLLLALATQDLLQGFNSTIRMVRQLTMSQDERKGVSTKVLQALRDHLSGCANVSTIASELAADSQRPYPASVHFEPFVSCPRRSDQNPTSLDKSIKSAIGDSATRLQSAVQTTGDQITQFGAMLGASENIRIQNKISILTWVLIALTIVLLADPLIGRAINHWGPSIVNALGKWPPW